MERRTFLKSLGAAAALLPLGESLGDSAGPAATDDPLDVWVAENDRRIARLLDAQQREQDHPSRGGFADRHGVYSAGATANSTACLLAGHLSPASKHHRSERVAGAIVEATDYLLRVQHPDGTIDLLSTNFHSPPDTAFVVEPVAVAMNMLGQNAPEDLPAFRDRAEAFLKNAARALTIGGIHTPNHRWVVCRALARIHKLFPDPALVQRIDRWLSEGIDIDPDGQYTERSAGVYTPLVNQCLIAVARLLGRPALLDPVRKNLEMTRYYIHANGELVTEASTRQDQYDVVDASKYYDSYRHLAALDGNRDFSAMAGLIERNVGLKRLSGYLIHLLEDPTWRRELPPAGSVPTDYARHFPHSKLARIRRGDTDATILADNHVLFTFFKGKASLQAVRMASAFFGKGQFNSPALEVEDGRYVLAQQLRGQYYQPFPEDRIPPDGDWRKMPRTERPESEVQNLASTVAIEEEGGRFALQFDVRGTDRVPVAIELAFRAGGMLSGVREVQDVSDAYLLEDGFGRYEVDGDVIEFGPGRAEHSWTQIHGAKPKLDALCVYLTGYTPFQLSLKVR